MKRPLTGNEGGGGLQRKESVYLRSLPLSALFEYCTVARAVITVFVVQQYSNYCATNTYTHT